MAFGRIVQAFVSVKVLYAHALAQIFKLDSGHASLIFARFGYDQFKNLLKVCIQASDASKETIKAVLKLIDKIHTRSLLRNSVAHASWKRGKRPGSIKPLVLKTKGSLLLLGIHHNEKDWTAEELNREADQILDLALSLGKHLRANGIHLDSQAHESTD
jgi:hypothetical protein